MVIFKKIDTAGKYFDDNAIPDLINYICRPDKTPSHIIGGYGVDLNDIANSMIAVSMHFRKYNRLRLHHFVISFGPEDIYLKDMIPKIANEICSYWADKYQIVYSLHEDTYNPHIHFVFNNVSYVDGRKCHFGKTEYRLLFDFIKLVMHSYYLYPVYSVKYYPEVYNPNE